MLLLDLLNSIETIEVFGALERNISNICTDSRACGPGDVFVAIRGQKSDGHDFLAQAVHNGAAAVVTEKTDSKIDIGVTPRAIVRNSRKALAILAHTLRAHPAQKLKIIGITGTNGKTTVSYILESLLCSAGRKTGVIGTTGYRLDGVTYPTSLTTPEPVELSAILAEMRDAGTEYVIMEVSSHAITQDRVHGIAFSGAIFTNLTRDHLDYHATVEEYAAAKSGLFRMLADDGIAVANADDSWGRFMTKDVKAGAAYHVGSIADTDAAILDTRLGLDGSAFTIRFAETYGALQGAAEIRMPLIGAYNIENAAAALAFCRAMGLGISELEAGMRNITPIPGRMQRFGLPAGGLALVDYAHTPDALQKALAACGELLAHTSGPRGKIICVFGCGGDRDRQKRPLMGAVAARLADELIITDDNPRNEDPGAIVQDILSGISAPSRCVVERDRSVAIQSALDSAGAGDIVLVAGKGHETYQEVGGKRTFFDDSHEIQRFIKESDVENAD